MASEPAFSVAGTGVAPADDSRFDVDEQRRYERIGVLGQGGMGRVYLVRDARLGREVALKELLHPSAALEARLTGEAHLTASLDHPGIVPVYDAGRTLAGGLFYTMRLVRGRTLATLASEAHSAAARLRLVDHVLDAARALAFAHEHGVVHRDVKPDNILIGPRGETQIGDWGLACRQGDAHAGDAAGTAGYLAPERTRGGPATPQSDVYALGATLLHVLTGAAPGTGARLERAATDEPPSPPTAPLVAGALRSIVERALAAEAAARFADAGELADELQRWREGRLIAGHRYTALELLRHALHVWRVPLLVGAAALVVLLVVGLVAWRRTRAERDRAVAAEHVADARAAALLRVRAKDLEATDARPEAMVLLAHADRPGDVETMGLRLATEATPRPTLHARAALAGCRVALPLAGETACGDDDGLRFVRADGAVRRRDSLAARRLGADGAGVLVLTRDDEVWRVPLVGDAERLGRAPPYTSGLGGDPALGVRWAFNPGWLTLYAGGVLHDVMPCAPHVELLAVHARDGALRLLCSDGVVGLVEPSEIAAWPAGEPLPRLALAPQLAAPAPGEARATIALRRPAERVRGELRGVTTATPHGDRGWLVGTASGAVIHVDDAAQAVLSTRTSRGSVRQVLPLPGDRLLVVSEREGPEVLTATGAHVAALPRWASGLARRDGAVVELAGKQRSRWDLAALTPPRTEWPVGLASVAVASDGREVAVGGADGLVGRWLLASDAPRIIDAGLRQVAKAVALGPRGLVVGGVGLSGLYVERDGAGQVLPSRAAVQRLGWLADGTGWALRYEDGPVFFDAERLDETHAQRRHWIDASTTADGAAIVLLDARGAAFTASRHGVEARGTVPGATLIVAPSAAGPVITARGAEVTTPAGPRRLPATVTALALSPDARWLAVGDTSGALSLYAAPDYQLVARATRHLQRVSAIAFSRGDVFVSVGWDRRALRWSLAPLARRASVAEVEAAWGMTLDDVLQGERE